MDPIILKYLEITATALARLKSSLRVIENQETICTGNQDLKS
jgi:hypothetical protein